MFNIIYSLDCCLYTHYILSMYSVLIECSIFGPKIYTTVKGSDYHVIMEFTILKIEQKPLMDSHRQTHVYDFTRKRICSILPDLGCQLRPLFYRKFWRLSRDTQGLIFRIT